jgi:hypothetical protein
MLVIAAEEKRLTVIYVVVKTSNMSVFIISCRSIKAESAGINPVADTGIIRRITLRRTSKRGDCYRIYSCLRKNSIKLGSI